MGAADDGVLSATGVDVFADWVEFADKVEFDDNVEFGEVELEGSKVGTIEAAVAVELLSEDALACSWLSLRPAIAIPEKANKQIINRTLSPIISSQLVDAGTCTKLLPFSIDG